VKVNVEDISESTKAFYHFSSLSDWRPSFWFHHHSRSLFILCSLLRLAPLSLAHIGVLYHLGSLPIAWTKKSELRVSFSYLYVAFLRDYFVVSITFTLLYSLKIEIPISETIGMVCSKSKRVARAPTVSHLVSEFVMCFFLSYRFVIVSYAVRSYRFVYFFALIPLSRLNEMNEWIGNNVGPALGAH